MAAVFVCLFPWIANWALTLVNNTLTAAGTNAAGVGLAAFTDAGVYHKGLVALGSGAPLSSILWGCLVVFSVRSKSVSGIITALVSAALTYTGVIHSVSVGLNQQFGITIGYLLIAALFAYKYFADKNDPVVDEETVVVTVPDQKA